MFLMNVKRKISKKKIFIFIIYLILLLITYNYLKIIFYKSHNRNLLHAWSPSFENGLQSFYTLEEIEPFKDSIFLIETSSKKRLKFYEWCTIESSAKHHSDTSVYLLMSSPLIENSEIFKNITFSYRNIKFKNINIESFILNSPLSILWEKGKIQESKYRVSHLSDILRFLILYRYGGTYLDLDQVILKPFPSEIKNFLGKESFWLAAGVLRLERNHPVFKEIFKDLLVSFDGSNWGNNGPQLISRVLKRFCRVEMFDLNELNAQNCLGIKVYSSDKFYPVHWKNASMIFDEKYNGDILKIVKNTFSLHIWGRQIKYIDKHSNHSYSILSKLNCPLTSSYFT